MNRRFHGLHQSDPSAASDIPDGLFLVRVQRAQYRWHALKPFYDIRFMVVEPLPFAGKTFTSRLYCTAKTLWKLSWLLHDFGYDAEMLGRDEVDDKNLVGLRGVVKLSHIVLNGTTLPNLGGFAPTSQWRELSAVAPANASSPEGE